jgi:hypothetical protein
MDSRNVGKSSKPYLDTFLHKCTVINFNTKNVTNFSSAKTKKILRKRKYFFL